MTRWLVPALFTCRYFPSDCTTQGQHPAHLAIRQMSGVFDGPLHGLRMAWGNCSFPLRRPQPRRGGCQRRFRRDVPQGGCTRCPASPVRTAAVRRCFFKGGCTFRTACATVLTACLAAPANPKPAPGRCSFGRPWGPGRVRCDAPRPFNDGTRGDGGGSHRLAAPSREQLCSHGRSPKPLVPLTRSNGSTRARAGRPSVRPLVPSSACLRCHRARRLQKPFRPMQRVHPDRC